MSEMMSKRPNDLRRIVTRVLGFAVLAFAAFSLGGVATAEGGTYEVRECDSDRALPNYPDARFVTTTAGYNGPVDCGTVGITVQNPVGISVGFSVYGAWYVTAPPETVITDMDFRYTLASMNGHSTAVSLTDENGLVAANWNGAPAGDVVGATQFSGRYKQLAAVMQCAGLCPHSPGATTRIRNLHFTVLDEAPPVLTALGGGIVNGGPRRGSESLSIAATDLGAGVSHARIRVNGVEIQRPQSECQTTSSYALAFSPCPPASYEVALNTELPPWQEGPNLIEACVYEYAQSGTTQNDCESRTVEVDNSCQASGGAVPATNIDAALEKRNAPPSTRIELKSNRGAELRGSLRGGAGTGIHDANVCLYETIAAPGHRRELVGIAKTRSDGTFAVQLSAGPSRSLDVAYRYNNHVVEKRQLQLDSRVAPTFRLRPKRLDNGATVRFSGRLPGPNQGGRQVAIQARVGTRWRTSRTSRPTRRAVSPAAIASSKRVDVSAICFGHW